MLFYKVFKNSDDNLIKYYKNINSLETKTQNIVGYYD